MMKINYRVTLAIILIVLATAGANCVSGGQDGTIQSQFAISTTTIATTSTDQSTIEPDNNASIDPTGINVIAEKDKILLSGEGIWIKAQLCYKGEPLRKKGANITFSSDNNSVATLPRFKYNQTDDAGSSWILLTSGDILPGRVKITANYNGRNGIISNSTYVDTLRWGTIAGLVRDKTSAGIPNANISLFNCIFNKSTKKWDNINLLCVNENPQLSNDGRTGARGLYTFYRVPVGTYNITAEKDGRAGSSIISLEQGTGTSFIVLPDYEYVGPLKKDIVEIPSSTVNGGTIWGIVSDQNKNGMINANVTLWYGVYNSTTGQWEKGDMVNISGNPQYSNNGRTRSPGEYQFDGVQQGVYYIMAESQGHSHYAVVRLKSNMAICFIALYDVTYISF